MSSKRPVGHCHLCLEYGPLSFEHTPPKAAFNNHPVLLAKYDDVINSMPGERVRGHVQQRGAGGHVFCERCNNQTGRWYAPSFIDWCEQGMNIMLRARGDPRLRYPIWVRPLPTLKQIVTMFFAINGPTFGLANPELLRFVHNRWAKGLPSQYRFFTYFMGAGDPRFFPVTVGLNHIAERYQIMSEISFPPFGYILTIESRPPDRRLCEITHFAHAGLNDFRPAMLDLVVLPTVARLPGDYRSAPEVVKTIQDNRAWRTSNSDGAKCEQLPLAERILPMMEKTVHLHERVTGRRHLDVPE